MARKRRRRRRKEIAKVTMTNEEKAAQTLVAKNSRKNRKKPKVDLWKRARNSSIMHAMWCWLVFYFVRAARRIVGWILWGWRHSCYLLSSPLRRAYIAAAAVHVRTLQLYVRQTKLFPKRLIDGDHSKNDRAFNNKYFYPKIINRLPSPQEWPNPADIFLSCKNADCSQCCPWSYFWNTWTYIHSIFCNGSVLHGVGVPKDCIFTSHVSQLLSLGTRQSWTTVSQDNPFSSQVICASD